MKWNFIVVAVLICDKLESIDTGGWPWSGRYQLVSSASDKIVNQFGWTSAQEK